MTLNMRSLERVREARLHSTPGKFWNIRYFSKCSCIDLNDKKKNALFRIPDTSKVRQKMLYASSKDALRKNLVGLAIEIQGTDASEVNI